MKLPPIENFAVISGIPTDQLKDTIVDQLMQGWTISEQNYIGEDLWELILVK